MSYHFIMQERDAGKKAMVMTILNSMTESERKEFLNSIYGHYADTDSIKVPLYDYLKIMRNDIDTIDEISGNNNNDIQSITEAVRIMLVAALSNEDTKFKRHLLETAYKELSKATTFERSPFD